MTELVFALNKTSNPLLFKDKMYLKFGAGEAWAGQVSERVAPWDWETRPIMAVENLGNVPPIGSKMQS